MSVETVALPIEAEDRSWNWGALVQDNVTTDSGVQYAVWWDTSRNPIIGKRDVDGTSWETFDLSGVAGNPLNAPVPNDGHNTLAVAVDSDGILHVAGNMHADPMRYIRSTSAGDITAWTDSNPPGGSLDRISYTKFVRAGLALLLFFRNGASSDSDQYMQVWNGTSWDAEVQLIDGMSTSEGVYLNHVAVADDVIHLGMTWRDGSSEIGVYNDVSHMVSRDGGTSWEAMDGSAISLPATHATVPLVYDSADTGSGLLNGTGLDVDSTGNPHLINHIYSGQFSRLLHSRWSGSSWINTVIMTDWQGRRDETDGIERPSLFCVGDRVFVIYRNNVDVPPPVQFRIREITDGDGGPDAQLFAPVPTTMDPTFDTRGLAGGRLVMLIPPDTLLVLSLSQIDDLFDTGDDGGQQPIAPVAQARISTRLTWLSCNLSDGQVITELPDLQGDEVSRVIGEYTSANLSLPIPAVGGRDLTLAQRAQLAIQSTQPPRTKIVAVVNDVPAWEGIPLPRDLGTDAQIPLGCVSMEGYLRHVYITDHTFDEQDVALIADGILRDAVTTPHGPGVALVIDAPNIGTIASRSYLDIDNQTVYAGLQELMKAGLMEWTLEPDWRSGFAYRIVDTIARVRGQLGKSEPTAVFQSATFSSQGASDARYQLKEDYGDDRYANVVRLHGAGQGEDQPRSAPAINQAALDAGVPVWELRDSAPQTVTQQALLDLHAERRLDRVRDGAHTLQITARWDAPGARLGVDWNLGDLVRHELRGHAHPGGLNGVKRAIGFALSLQRGTIRPILQDEEV